MPHTPISYPPQLYPHSQSQLHQILTDYYSLTLQVQTLQRHILKIQTQNEHQHQTFNDQVQKLKLYIDQCQNQIKKRQQRQLALIQRLKQLETSRCQEIEELKFSKTSKRENEQLRTEFEHVIHEKEKQWNHQRLPLIKDNEQLMLANLQLSKQISSIKNQVRQLCAEKQTLSAQIKRSHSQTAPYQTQIVRLKQAIEVSDSKIQELKAQNAHLKTLHNQAQLRLTEKQKILPISSSCPNCLKLSKLHEIQIEKKLREIQSLRKDIQSLLAFFEMTQ